MILPIDLCSYRPNLFLGKITDGMPEGLVFRCQLDLVVGRTWKNCARQCEQMLGAFGSLSFLYTLNLISLRFYNLGWARRKSDEKQQLRNVDESHLEISEC